MIDAFSDILTDFLEQLFSPSPRSLLLNQPKIRNLLLLMNTLKNVAHFEPFLNFIPPGKIRKQEVLANVFKVFSRFICSVGTFYTRALTQVNRRWKIFLINYIRKLQIWSYCEIFNASNCDFYYSTCFFNKSVRQVGQTSFTKVLTALDF